MFKAIIILLTLISLNTLACSSNEITPEEYDLLVDQLSISDDKINGLESELAEVKSELESVQSELNEAEISLTQAQTEAEVLKSNYLVLSEYYESLKAIYEDTIESKVNTTELIEKGLLLRITTDKKEYGPNEPVMITMYAENVSSDTIEYINYGCGPGDFRVSIDGHPYFTNERVREVDAPYGTSTCLAFTQNLEPADSITRIFLWDQQYSEYPNNLLAPSAKYKVIGSIDLEIAQENVPPMFLPTTISVTTDIYIKDTLNTSGTAQ